MTIVAESKAVIRWPQDQRVLVGGSYDIYRDGRDGVVVYDATHKVTDTPVAAWPEAEGKIGDGFGADGLGADGFGEEAFGDSEHPDGFGMDGFGGLLLEHVTPPLTDGDWTFAVVALDAAGNPSPASGGTEAQATLAGTPKPPASLATDTWNDGTGTLTLSLGLSPNDEGA